MSEHAISAQHAEMSLLGSLLLDPKQIGIVRGIVSAGDFNSEAHAAIFDAIGSVYEHTGTGDLVQIVEAIKGRGQLEQVGGDPYIIQLANSVPSAVSAPHYARTVHERATARRARDIFNNLAHRIETGASGSTGSIYDLLDEAQDRLRALGDIRTRSDVGDMADVFQTILDDLDTPPKRRPANLGLRSLDHMTGGIHPGEVCVLAARPSMGKTSFALQAALHTIDMGSGVVFVSAEMDRAAIGRRIIASLTSATMQALRAGGRDNVSNDDIRDIMRLQGRIARSSLHVIDRDRTLSGIRASVRKIVRDAEASPRHIGLVVIDYIGLLTPGDRYRGSRTNEVGEISRGIKALAMEANVPILLLSQLNRQVEHRDGNRPRMSDLRDTGDIEQDADQIVFIHREDYYHATDQAWINENAARLGVTELLVEKNRNGARGSVECRWHPERMRLADHSTLAFDNAA